MLYTAGCAIRIERGTCTLRLPRLEKQLIETAAKHLVHRFRDRCPEIIQENRPGLLSKEVEEVLGPDRWIGEVIQAAREELAGLIDCQAKGKPYYDKVCTLLPKALLDEGRSQQSVDHMLARLDLLHDAAADPFTIQHVARQLVDWKCPRASLERFDERFGEVLTVILGMEQLTDP